MLARAQAAMTVITKVADKIDGKKRSKSATRSKSTDGHSSVARSCISDGDDAQSDQSPVRNHSRKHSRSRQRTRAHTPASDSEDDVSDECTADQLMEDLRAMRREGVNMSSDKPSLAGGKKTSLAMQVQSKQTKIGQGFPQWVRGWGHCVTRNASTNLE